MSDVKDILGVRGTPAEKQDAGGKPKKPVKEKMKRPEGMSREAFALLGDSHPIISTQLVAKKKDMKAKPKPTTKGIVTWRWQPFTSSARTDNLQLHHWSKGYKDAAGRMKEPDETDYFFAKYNKKVQLTRYNDEEWEHLIKPDSGTWTRAETDYLLDMCERFDLRFVVIADRYEYTPPPAAPGTAPTPAPPQRTIEDLKERYYGIARRLLIAREGGEAAVANHVLVKTPFSKAAELERKQAIEVLLARTHQQTAEENAILAEARLIEERRKAEAAAARKPAPTPTPAAPTAAAAAAAAAGRPGTPSGGVSRGTPAPAAAGTAPGGTAAGAAQMSAAGPGLRYPESFPNNPGPGTPSLFTEQLTPFRPPKPGVYARGMHSAQLVRAAAARQPGGVDRVLESMDTVMLENLGPRAANYPSPRYATRAVSGAWLALRQEVLALLELRRLAGPAAPSKARAGAGGEPKTKKRK